MSDSDPRPLFREEALEHHARHLGEGDVARVGSVWVDRLYWALLALVVVGAAVAWRVEIDGTRLLDVLLRTG